MYKTAYKSEYIFTPLFMLKRNNKSVASILFPTAFTGKQDKDTD